MSVASGRKVKTHEAENPGSRDGRVREAGLFGRNDQQYLQDGNQQGSCLPPFPEQG